MATALASDNLQSEFSQTGFAVARQLFSSREIDDIRNVFMRQAADGPVLGLSEMVKGAAASTSGSYPNTSPDRFRRSLIFHYVPLGSQELSHWYKRSMTFDGQIVEVPPVTGGGPCGTPDEQGAVQ